MQARVVRIGLNTALLVTTIVFCLVLIEIGIRIFFPSYDPSGQVQLFGLSDGTVVGRPGAVLRQSKNTGDYDVHVRFNSFGFRDDKLLTAATDRDLFVVGDSFPFGWGVEVQDRFSDKLQSILSRPVFNIAIPGLDFDGYSRLLRYAETHGTIIKNLIISVTMENDLGVYDDSETPASPPPSPRRSPLQLQLSMIKAYFTGHSALYVAATHAVHKTGWLRSIAAQLGLLIPNLDGIPDPVGSTDVLTTSAARVLQLAKGRNTIVLIIPSRQLWVGTATYRAEAARIHETFIDSLRRSGMVVVDLRDRFERDGKPLSYHFANDGHWNKEGHRLAAEALAEVLQP